jgi:hypothetical protein
MKPDLSLQRITKNALESISSFSKSDLTVEFVDIIMERARLSGNNIEYKDPFLLIQLESGARGACFLHSNDISEDDLEGIAGRYIVDLLQTERIKHSIKIAIIDAAYEMINAHEGLLPRRIITLTGLANQKSKTRALELIDLARVERHEKILFIGAIADLIWAAKQKDTVVRVADFALSGSCIEGLNVEYDANPIINWADRIVMTGNTLKTDTITDLLTVIQNRKIPLLIYALTGANFAPRYLDYGADTVTCEKFPYYWYSNLESSIWVYQK